MNPSRQAIVTGTLVCGTLDILSAFAFGSLAGASPGRILRYVASGPFGDSMRKGGMPEAALGLLTHYVLMAIMVAVFVTAAQRWAAIRQSWIISGTAYGMLIYLVMYWIVTPTRFGAYPGVDAWSVGNALFSHIFCVGLPMAWITARTLGVRGALAQG